MSRQKAICKKYTSMRENLFPGIMEKQLWTANGGFAQIPRVISRIGFIMNELSKTNISTTYFTLWLHNHSHNYITVKESEFAAESNFTGTRAISTWKHKMKILKKEKWIDYNTDATETITAAVILNPYDLLLEKEDFILKNKKTETHFKAIKLRLIEMNVPKHPLLKKTQAGTLSL